MGRLLPSSCSIRLYISNQSGNFLERLRADFVLPAIAFHARLDLTPPRARSGTAKKTTVTYWQRVWQVTLPKLEEPVDGRGDGHGTFWMRPKPAPCDPPKGRAARGRRGRSRRRSLRRGVVRQISHHPDYARQCNQRRDHPDDRQRIDDGMGLLGQTP